METERVRKATPVEWDMILGWSVDGGDAKSSALLELRSRVEALEGEENENLTILERRVYELEEINRLALERGPPAPRDAETTRSGEGSTLPLLTSWERHDLWEAIKHGDEVHRQWLRLAIEAWSYGKQVPPAMSISRS